MEVLNLKIKIYRNLYVEYEKRQQLTSEESAKYKMISLIVAFFIMSIIFAALGVNPFTALGSIFSFSLFNPSGIAAVITRMIPLLLCGVGLAIAYKALFWNIGAEGQLLLGATLAIGIGVFTPGIPETLLLPIILIMGFLVGALWGIIPTILKLKLKINEVITTLMLNYIAINLVKYLIYGPWKGPYSFPLTDLLPVAAWEPLIPGTSIYIISLILALTLALGAYYLLFKTTIGYEIRVVGENIKAAKYAGIHYTKTLLITMIISGGLAGLAGAGLITGVQHRLTTPEAISPGYGYTAIIVAWLGGLNPVYIIFASLFMSILIVGGQNIQILLGLPFGVVNIFNGVILAVITAFEFLKMYKIRFTINRELIDANYKINNSINI
jgi:simple sugar transport system permease protein